MSKFYGMIQGNRGVATRGGSKNSGYMASCQSYDGSVITRMWYDDNDKLVVSLEVSDGSHSFGDTIFRGSIEELRKKLEK